MLFYWRIDMARPSKTAAVIKLEKNKDHRTKKQLAARERAEKALLTGKAMIETADVRNDRTAHLEFLRLKPLLKAIEKFDEIYGNPVRRYCLNKSKLADIDAKIEQLEAGIEEIHEEKSKFKSVDEYYRLITKMNDTITKQEQLAKAIRAEMNDFEKQNCMTIRSALAAIPKKPETKANALKEALGV